MDEAIIAILCLGGPSNCLPLRMEKLVNEYNILKKDSGCKIQWILTGYPHEIEYMKDFLGQSKITDTPVEVSTYDTVSNLEDSKRYWNDCDTVIMSTSISHAKRVKYIVGNDVYTKFQYIPSGENEVWYSAIAEMLYKYLATRKLLQYTAFILRRTKM